MKYLQVILTSLFSIIVIFAVTRILGYRQLSELSLFDYANGITIGSIAAELATAERDEIGVIAVAIVIYGAATLLLSVITDKSITLRKLITGKPIVLMQRGKLYYGAFRRAHLDIDEFLMKCRNNGYFDLSDIDTAVLEPNGRVSFIPAAANRPATVADLKVSTTQDTLTANVIVDGKIIDSTLAAAGKDKKWLMNKLHGMKIDDLDSIFLAICDSRGELTVFEKNKGQPKSLLE